MHVHVLTSFCKLLSVSRITKLLYCTVLYCTALHCTALHCTALHCTALRCTALHCTALYCTVLYCIVLRSILQKHGGNDLSFTSISVSCRGSRDGAVVKAFTSHQCGPCSSPGLDVRCGLSLLLVRVLAPRGFSVDTSVFPSPQKPTSLNSNSIWTQGTTKN